MELLAQDALKVADHVGWEKFHLMGASMGTFSSLSFSFTFSSPLIFLLFSSLFDLTKRTTAIIKHLLGGMIAQRLAVSAPQRIRTLTLLCTRFDSGWWHSLPSVCSSFYSPLLYSPLLFLRTLLSFWMSLTMSYSGQQWESLSNNTLKHTYGRTRPPTSAICWIYFFLPSISKILIQRVQQTENIY